MDQSAPLFNHKIRKGDSMSNAPQGIPIWQVDAFADRPFTGNPAAVCILENYPSDSWMQSVAAEMNLSETAFIVSDGDANRFQLRWFTPATEVDLCGHATLAAAHVLMEQRQADASSPIRFQTRSGELLCTASGLGITLDFPTTPATDDVDGQLQAELLAALGLQEALVLRSRFDLVVVVSQAQEVEALHPDFNALEKIETRGVMVTAASQVAGIDFISRFFAPRCGINEDPVTGSAHCCLAPYWSQRLGQPTLIAHQASPRGGTIHCQVLPTRVLLTGTAITVLTGRLNLTPE
jgi:PhzF family phenazine biosynthesis protein